MALVSAIQKDWKDDNTNLVEIVLQIIKYFEFIQGNKNTQKVIQTSDPLIHQVLKGSSTNLKYVKKGLTTH